MKVSCKDCIAHVIAKMREMIKEEIQNSLKFLQTNIDMPSTSSANLEQLESSSEEEGAYA